jgi:hypothetical protein
MRLTMNKITFGFLILAFGMMLTDCYRLMHAPAEVALSASNSAHSVRKF